MIHRGQVTRLFAVMSVTAAWVCANAAQGESYLCVTSQVTGFHYSESNNRWTSMNFTSESKYVLSRPPNDSDPEFASLKRWAQMVGHVGPIDWIVRTVGSQNYEAVCSSPQKEKLEGALQAALGVMRCSGILSEFMLNLSKLRFQHYLWGNYSLDVKPRDDTAIEIGECTKL
jgi:hypothetical protein